MKNMQDKLVGRYGEEIAAAFLRKKGYTILASGYSCRSGEIDLIAQKGDVVAFVEVKTRKSQRYLPASAAVDREKERRILETADHWIAANESRAQFSFDIIEVYTEDKTIRHIRNAFV